MTTPNIGPIVRRDQVVEIKAHLAPTSVEPVSGRFSSVRVAPDTIRVIYALVGNLHDPGEWTLRSIELSGWRVRKDGSPGQQESSASFWGGIEAPQWAIDWAQANWPGIASKIGSGA